MKSFYSKEEYTIDDIISLIDNEVEESINLDFKEARAIDKSDPKKAEIAKDVSSFANSDGGIIIYGIQEKNHKAESITPIDGNIYTKEWFEHIINSNIHRNIPDLRIIPIRIDGKIDQSIYIVKIPCSLEAPHQSKNKKFYKRYNFESVSMEEYEVRQLYGRKVKSKLIIYQGLLSDKEANDNLHKNFILELTCANDGNVVESMYKVNVYFKNINNYINFKWDRLLKNYDHTCVNDMRFKISAVGQVPIYPQEMVTTIRFEIEILKEKLYDAFNDVSIEFRLYYSNGEDSVQTTLLELYNELVKSRTKANP